jgi:hypothetical protein
MRPAVSLLILLLPTLALGGKEKHPLGPRNAGIAASLSKAYPDVKVESIRSYWQSGLVKSRLAFRGTGTQTWQGQSFPVEFTGVIKDHRTLEVDQRETQILGADRYR